MSSESEPTASSGDWVLCRLGDYAPLDTPSKSSYRCARQAAALGFLGFCVVGGSADGRIIMPSGFFLAPDLTSEAIAPNPAKDILVTNVAVNDLPLPFARHFERSETVPIFDSNSQDRISWPLLVTLTGRHGRQCAGLGKPHEKTLHNPKAAANIAQRYVDVPFLRVAFDGLGECRNDARALKNHVDSSPCRRRTFRQPRQSP